MSRALSQEHFEALASRVMKGLAAGEDALLWFQGERSDFVRFNRGRVRQPGSVTQAELQLRLLRGQRHASATVTLGGRVDDDGRRVDGALEELRCMVASVPEDPHLLWEMQGASTTASSDDALPDAMAITEAIVDASGGQDLVGILVAGELTAGFASSRGQRNWDRRCSYLVDFCLYVDAAKGGDKAVKSTMGGVAWDGAAFASKMEAAQERLAVLGQPARRLDPGRYRVWLAPAAVTELFELLAWGSFGKRGYETRTSALLKLAAGDARLSPVVSLSEDTAGGLGPAFTREGFQKPTRVPLIEGGRLAGSLISPRSAREYGVQTNGADEGESPRALSLAPGTLPESEVLERLGTGLFVTNLWYLNWSDRPAARLTGMTRFATVWVQDGRIVAPAEVLRFDDTLYHMLGSGLEALGQSAELLPSTDTYERRSTASTRTPGALIDGLKFTL